MSSVAITACTAIICALWVVVIIYIILGYKKSKNVCTISFKETLELVEVPVATFKIKAKNGKMMKMNFIIDTGASSSFIDINEVNKISEKCCKEYAQSESVCSAGGEIKASENTYMIEFGYDDYVFNTEFFAIDLTDVRAYTKTNYGVNIVGMIGSDFLNAENTKIDYVEYRLKINGKKQSDN